MAARSPVLASAHVEIVGYTREPFSRCSNHQHSGRAYHGGHGPHLAWCLTTSRESTSYNYTFLLLYLFEALATAAL
jgi:hypothetical protein